MSKNILPIISLVGYTNAGKSTLLNSLTQSDVYAEKKMFATLDPTSRRLRLPYDQEVIINDTVGFIRDLPEALVSAFRATLEEIADSDLLVHVVDASHPQVRNQIASVEQDLHRSALYDTPDHRFEQDRSAGQPRSSCSSHKFRLTAARNAWQFQLFTAKHLRPYG